MINLCCAWLSRTDSADSSDRFYSIPVQPQDRPHHGDAWAILHGNTPGLEIWDPIAIFGTKPHKIKTPWKAKKITISQPGRPQSQSRPASQPKRQSQHRNPNKLPMESLRTRTLLLLNGKACGLLLLMGSLVVMEAYSFAAEGYRRNYFVWADSEAIMPLQNWVYFGSTHMSKLMLYASIQRLSEFRFHRLFDFLFFQEFVALVHYWLCYSNDTFDTIRLIICGVFIAHTLWRMKF